MFYDDSVGVHTLVYTHAPFYTAHRAHGENLHSKTTFAYHTHYWPHTFKHFCLSSTKNSGPQARHPLNSSETTNINFMLPLNPSWASQNGVDSSMKQSKELWIILFIYYFFASIWFSLLSLLCLAVCVAFRHLLPWWFYQVEEVFLLKKKKGGGLWHFNLPHLLLGAC